MLPVRIRLWRDYLVELDKEEQKKIDAKLGYRKDSPPDFKLPEKLPDILGWNPY